MLCLILTNLFYLEGKKKKRLEVLFVQAQSYRLNELRLDDKPSGPKANVIKYGKKTHIFSIFRDKHLEYYFLYLPILLICLYSSFWITLLSLDFKFFPFLEHIINKVWLAHWETVETVSDFIFYWAPKSLQMVTAAMKLKDAYSLEGKLWPT